MRRVVPTFSIFALIALAASLGATPTAHAIGILVPTQPNIEPLMIRSHRVSVQVRERSAETSVDQVFHNHTAQMLEATYVFPIPQGATVSGFAMYVNGQRVQGELLDSTQARTIYEGIVARMRDPGLVEYMGGNLFRARVFPIQPNSDQRIEIRFTQTLDYDNGVIHYRYPLHTSGRAARTEHDLTFTADIVSRTAIRAVYSPSHAISVARPDDHHATVGFEGNQVVLSDDFDLYYTVQDSDVGLSLLTHKLDGEDGYFLAMIAPRTEVTQREIAAKEVLFVFDTSGSMAGDKIARAKAALDYMLARLNPTDRFQVVRFSTDVEALFDGGRSVQATPDNVARARRFVAGYSAAGGTAIQPALAEALRTPIPEGNMPRMVVFLTDGMPTVGETDPARILTEVAGRSGDARLFVFGVGDDVNTTFLDALAEQNRGTGDYFRDGAEMERRLSSFYDRIAYPLLTDLHLAIPGVSSYDVYPRDLGHLYRGGQLLVVGRYRGDGASRMALTGHLAGDAASHEFPYDVSFPARQPQNDFLPRLWATRKVGYLLDEIRLHGERAELRDEVVQIARRFGIVTPYTSFLVVDDEALIPRGIPTPMPVPDRMEFSVEDNGAGGPRNRAPMAPPAEAAAGADFEAFDQATVAAAPPSRPATQGAPTASPSMPAQAAPQGGQGQAGRALSRRLRDMREAERDGDTATARIQVVQGRTFELRAGMWMDQRWTQGIRELRVRPMSAAYFALLRARPELRATFALGERVTVTLDARHAVVVDASAPEVSEAQVQQFLAQ